MKKSLAGKIIAVTGCTGGLGKELCIKLIKYDITLVMLDRNHEKSKQLADELLKINPNSKIVSITTDLEDMDSVCKATQQLVKLNPDIFIHNAGAYKIPRHVCKTGYDNIFQINFVSPYYIVRKLQERNKDIKIVAVEPKNSAVLSGEAAGPHGLQGIGAGFIPEVLDTGVIDQIIKVEEKDAYFAARLLGAKEGIFTGISSGAALFAAIELARQNENKNKKIAVILPDTGDRYLSTAMFE